MGGLIPPLRPPPKRPRAGAGAAAVAATVDPAARRPRTGPSGMGGDGRHSVPPVARLAGRRTHPGSSCRSPAATARAATAATAAAGGGSAPRLTAASLLAAAAAGRRP